MSNRRKPKNRSMLDHVDLTYALRFTACIMWCGVGFSSGTTEGTISGVASLLFIVAMFVELVYS